MPVVAAELGMFTKATATNLAPVVVVAAGAAVTAEEHLLQLLRVQLILAAAEAVHF
jgi:hypothetical protein